MFDLRSVALACLLALCPSQVLKHTHWWAWEGAVAVNCRAEGGVGPWVSCGVCMWWHCAFCMRACVRGGVGGWVGVRVGVNARMPMETPLLIRE